MDQIFQNKYLCKIGVHMYKVPFSCPSASHSQLEENKK